MSLADKYFIVVSSLVLCNRYHFSIKIKMGIELPIFSSSFVSFVNYCIRIKYKPDNLKAII